MKNEKNQMVIFAARQMTELNIGKLNETRFFGIWDLISQKDLLNCLMEGSPALHSQKVIPHPPKFLESWNRVFRPYKDSSQLAFPIPPLWFYLLMRETGLPAHTRIGETIAKIILAEKINPYSLLREITNRRYWGVTHWLRVCEKAKDLDLPRFLIDLANKNKIKIFFEYLYSLKMLNHEAFICELEAMNFEDIKEV